MAKPRVMWALCWRLKGGRFLPINGMIFHQKCLLKKEIKEDEWSMSGKAIRKILVSDIPVQR